MHGRQVSGVPLNQRGGQLAIEHQLLGAIGVGHDAFEQLHALQNTRFDLLPVGLGHHQGEKVERPRPLRLVGCRIHVVSDAVVTHLPVQVVHAGVQPGQAFTVQVSNEALPSRAQWGVARLRAGGVQFIPMAFRRGQGLLRQSRHGRDRPAFAQADGGIIHRTIVAQALRKSSVLGNSGLACTKALGGSVGPFFKVPGVCPMRKKRARRRLSAS